MWISVFSDTLINVSVIIASPTQPSIVKNGFPSNPYPRNQPDHLLRHARVQNHRDHKPCHSDNRHTRISCSFFPNASTTA